MVVFKEVLFVWALGRQSFLPRSSGSGFTTMARFSILMLICGVAIFSVGVISRAYMNAKIEQAFPKDGFQIRFTESWYQRLVRDAAAPKLPLVLALVCIPLGMIVAFAAILLSDH